MRYLVKISLLKDLRLGYSCDGRDAVARAGETPALLS